MARRKAEVVEQTGISEPVTWPPAETLSEHMDAALAAEAPQQRFTARLVGIGGSNSATLDAILARLSAIPSMTDRAAINALAEAVADLARLMR